MSRTLSTLSDAHRQRADVAWVRLATVTLWRDRYGAAPASLTLYLSDATRYLPVDGGGTREYLPLVLQWGAIGDSLEAVNPTTAPASLDLRCANQVPIAAGGVTAAHLTDLIRAGTNVTGYDVGGGDLRIQLLPPGGTLGIDELTVYVGRIDTIDPTDDAISGTATIRSTSVEGGARIVLEDARVNAFDDPFPGWYIDLGVEGLYWSDFGDSRPGHGPNVPIEPPVTCASGSAQGDYYCSGPPSFPNVWTDYLPDTFNTVGFDVFMIVDYTRLPDGIGLNVSEQGYAALYRAIVDVPGTTLQFGINTGTSGKFLNFVYDSPATVQVLALQEPTSVAVLQAHSYDTIRAVVNAVLGEFLTDDPGPHSCPINGHRFIGFRIKPSDYPPVPGPANVKNYTEADLTDVKVIG